MWFKNSLNSINNTFNKPSKLLRLDSTGETTKENCDYMPPIQVISSYVPKERKSYFDFSPLQFKFVNNVPPYRFMDSFSSKNWDKGREIIGNAVDNKMSNGKMRGVEVETRSWRSRPNHGRTPKTQNRFWRNPRNFNSLKVPADSPWLKVNSGYNQPHNGSFNNYSHFWGPRNNFCDKNNSSTHKIKTKHKKVSDEKRKIVQEAQSHSIVEHKPLKCDVSGKDFSEMKPVIKDISPSIPSKPTVSVPSKPTVSDVCSKSESEISQESVSDTHETKLASVAKEVEVIKEIKASCENESRIPKCPEVLNVTYSLDSCVADLFQDGDSNSKETGNFQIQCEPNSQQIRITEMATPSSSSIPSAISCQSSSVNSNPQIYLSIIGGKCQSKQQTPPNSVCSQSKINKECQSNQTAPSDSNQSKKNCDSKSAQEKNCSLCMAYMSRVDPKCTEFPKSAGCNHSTILLRVRNTPKKTKKRKNHKEKSDVKKTSPSTFIVGVNSSDSPEKSHIFQFFSNVSDSDDSWDSFSDDEDETDSAACDWSKLEMDKLFPSSNGLFNPMKFNVHISQSDSETTDPSSPTNNYLDSINLSWNIQIVQNQSKDSTFQKSKTQKKVRFEEGDKLTTVYRMVAWSYAYRASRKGPWEQYARDRERFHRKIRDMEAVLSEILEPNHRSKIYNSIFA